MPVWAIKAVEVLEFSPRVSLAADAQPTCSSGSRAASMSANVPAGQLTTKHMLKLNTLKGKEDGGARRTFQFGYTFFLSFFSFKKKKRKCTKSGANTLQLWIRAANANEQQQRSH